MLWAVVQVIGVTLRAPQLDGDRIRANIGKRRRFEEVEVLERNARERVPAEIQTGRKLADVWKS